jgi:hypothetical protein
MLLIIGVGIGILFCIVIQPILEGLVQTTISWLTLVNTHIAAKIAKINSEISNLQDSADGAESIPKIGFYMPDENEICEDDDDEDKLYHRGK